MSALEVVWHVWVADQFLFISRWIRRSGIRDPSLLTLGANVTLQYADIAAFALDRQPSLKL